MKSQYITQTALLEEIKRENHSKLLGLPDALTKNMAYRWWLQIQGEKQRVKYESDSRVKIFLQNSILFIPI